MGSGPGTGPPRTLGVYFLSLKNAEIVDPSAKTTDAPEARLAADVRGLPVLDELPAVVAERRLPVVTKSTSSTAPAPLAQLLSLIASKEPIAARLVCSTEPAKTLNLSGIVEPPLAEFQMVVAVGAGRGAGAATKTEFGTPTGW